MNIKNIDEFNKVIDTGDFVLVDFYAEWCGPCKMLLPIINSIIEENKDIKILKVNIDDVPELAEKYSVQSIPTLLFIKDKEEVERHGGFIAKEALLEKIKKLN